MDDVITHPSNGVKVTKGERELPDYRILISTKDSCPTEASGSSSGGTSFLPEAEEKALYLPLRNNERCVFCSTHITHRTHIPGSIITLASSSTVLMKVKM